MVECVHRAEGCMYTCQRQHLAKHLLDSCAYRKVREEDEDSIPSKDALSHTHESHNNDDTQEAVNKNYVTLISKSSNLSHQGRSSATETQHPRNQTSTSVSCAPAAALESTRIGPPLINHSAPDSSDPRLAALTEQNIILRQRVEGLEGLLHGVNREMAVVKRALGPWYRPGDGIAVAVPASYYSAELPAGVQPFSASSSNGSTFSASSPEVTTSPGASSAYRHSYPPVSSPGVTIPSVHSLAPFFPPDSAEYETAQGTDPTRSYRTSSNVDPYAIGSGAFHPNHVHAYSPMIAPLNLSTTLEGSLHGLRESVVGLAASVDSMGRRHEIALTNETARMAEEVGGLRAGLHGLRMQVGSFLG